MININAVQVHLLLIASFKLKFEELIFNNSHLFCSLAAITTTMILVQAPINNAPARIIAVFQSAAIEFNKFFRLLTKACPLKLGEICNCYSSKLWYGLSRDWIYVWI